MTYRAHCAGRKGKWRRMPTHRRGVIHRMVTAALPRMWDRMFEVSGLAAGQDFGIVRELPDDQRADFERQRVAIEAEVAAMLARSTPLAEPDGFPDIESSVIRFEPIRWTGPGDPQGDPR